MRLTNEYQRRDVCKELATVEDALKNDKLTEQERNNLERRRLTLSLDIDDYDEAVKDMKREQYAEAHPDEFNNENGIEVEDDA